MMACPLQDSFSQLRKWEDLEINTITKIFNGVPSCDLANSVCLVCKTWQLGCWNALCWEKDKLDLSAAMAVIENLDSGTGESLKNQGFIEERFEDLDVKLMKLLKKIMEGRDAHGSCLEHWSSSIRNIFIPKDLPISDEHLLYIAQRTASVESVFILQSSRITRRGFLEAINNWKNIKHMGFGQFNGIDFTEVVEEIGKNYSDQLGTLHINHPHLKLDESNLHAVRSNLPKLKTLTFEAAYVLRNNRRTLLRGFCALEKIHFCDCYLTLDGSECQPLKQNCISFNFRFEKRVRQSGGEAKECIIKSDSIDKIWEWMTGTL